ncbi:MAG: YdeI/OmpD-associated family protein [Crocinitomicaceae bacterium]
MEKINSVHEYIEAKPICADCILLLREILLSTPVEECMKWSAPAYTHNGENIIGLAAYNSYVGIWFHQGVFLADSANVLYNANKSKTKGLRQWRFSSFQEIESNATLINEYINEAITNQKAGKKIKISKKKPLIIPDELKMYLDNDSELNSAFSALLHGKKVEYANYISEAKQDKTKRSRLEKIIPMICNGEGLNDKYKSSPNK